MNCDSHDTQKIRKEIEILCLFGWDFVIWNGGCFIGEWAFEWAFYVLHVLLKYLQNSFWNIIIDQNGDNLQIQQTLEK
jgi:hypothetical protein